MNPARISPLVLARHALTALVMLVGARGAARATCNVIPGVSNTFRGARGTIDRPFAGPGDVLTLRLSASCDGDASAFGTDPGALVATFVFTPPAGPRNVVALAADCGALAERLARCRGRGDVAGAVCVPARTSMPEGGVDLALRDGRLDVRVPDTDALLPPAGDGRGFTGAAAVAITGADDELPCALAAQPCREQAGALACIDELYSVNDTCDRTPHELFSHFTALPAANEYGALCSDGRGCSGAADELRFTIDADGNVLAPIHWSDVLPPEKVDLARLVRATVAVRAFPDRPDLVRVPNRGFLHAYSPEGSVLPPLFLPQRDPTAPDGVTLFGTADADRGVVRVDRRSVTFHACAGGANDGLPCYNGGDCPAGRCRPATCNGGSRAGEPCAGDGECPEGECGAALFDFRTRLTAGVGPVTVARTGAGACARSGTACGGDGDCAAGDHCAGFTLRAQNPVGLDGLFESDTMLVSVIPEAFAKEDLDGDGDQTDDVLLLTDRVSGARLAIGRDGAPGRAVARIDTPPLSFPAVVVADDLVAFLEPEPLAGEADLNGDGDAVDTILRVFQRTPNGIVELTEGRVLTADAAPVIDGDSLAIIGGQVIFRTAEASAAPRRIRRVSVASDGAEADAASAAPAISADGRQVAFESAATNLAPGLDAHGVFVHELDSGVTTALPLRDPRHDGGWPGVRVPPGAAAESPALSGDGRYVAVAAPDELGRKQVWITDRDADGNGVFDESDGVSTAIVSTDVRGRQPGEKDSLFPSLTPDAQLLTFLTASRNLHVDGAGKLRNMWQHWDPDTDTVLASDAVESGGVLANTDSLRQLAPIAPNGDVVFSSPADNLVDDDTNDFCLNAGGNTRCADIFVYSPLYWPLRVRNGDREDYRRTGFERVSLDSDGRQANQQSSAPAISWDGRFVGFISVASNLVPGDTNGTADVFLRDRRARTTTRVSVASDRAQADGPSFDRVLALSADGRYLAFTSTATNLAPGSTLCDADGDGRASETCANVYLHDRFTGFTQRVSAGLGGAAPDGPSSSPAMSADGLTVAFRSEAGNLVAGDDNRTCARGGRPINCGDIFVSEPDPAALAADPALDLDGDGDLDDTVLRAFDPQSRTVTTIGRASAAAAAGDGVAFLSPECDGGARACRHGIDLNGDGDLDDTVAFFWRPGAAAENLRQDGREIAASDSVVAVVTDRPRPSAVPQDGPYTSLNVYRIGDAPGQWAHVDRDAADVQVAGHIVAFTEGEYWPNGLTRRQDFDAHDRVLRVYDAEQRAMRAGLEGAFAQAADDFVLGTSLLAFSQREGSRGQGYSSACDPNDDHDCLDGVLEVYDLAADEVMETGQAVTPCAMAACKPRHAFQVSNETVTFLTDERQQGDRDLNQDGKLGLVLQSFNVRAARAAHAAATAGAAAVGSGGSNGAVTVLGAIATGVCTTTGEPCVAADACGSGGECYLPPGGCLVDLGTTCDFLDPAIANHGCPSGAFCEPTRFGRGRCRVQQGPCASDADCSAPAHCSDGGTSLQRLLAPFTDRSADDGQLFVGSGRCVEDLGTACSRGGSACAAGLSCDVADAASGRRTCQRRYGTCRTDADCAAGALCRNAAIVAAAADSDGDEIPDPYDNCPFLSNVDQLDSTGSGVGDACRGSASPSPTAFPTVTRTPSPPAGATVPATPTAMATRTATGTLTATPTRPATATARDTVTPTRRNDGGGCAIGRGRRGAADAVPVLFALALAALCGARRRR
ncbi:hypothetical protein KF840_02030 [bacterium]|nr:hypothetical protein [bacterium]